MPSCPNCHYQFNKKVDYWASKESGGEYIGMTVTRYCPNCGQRLYGGGYKPPKIAPAPAPAISPSTCSLSQPESCEECEHNAVGDCFEPTPEAHTENKE